MPSAQSKHAEASTLSRVFDVLSQVWEKFKGDPNTIKYAAGSAALGAVGTFATLAFLRYKKRLVREVREQQKELVLTNAEDQGMRRQRGSLDKDFFGRLRLLLSIVIPSWRSVEVLQLVALAIVVVSRTFVSNWLSSISGDISKDLIDLDFKNFCWSLGLSTSLSLVSALLAPTLKYLTNRLALRWRIALTKHVHKRYMQNMMYYKTAYLHDDVPNPDQVITQDIDKFCDGMTGLFANLLKPVADLLLYTTKLILIAGYGGPTAVVLYTFISFFMVTVLRPPFSGMTSNQQNLEGNFRYCHLRTVTNGESIAFYGGDALEKQIANKSFEDLYKHKKTLIKSRFLYGIYNDLFVFNLPQTVSWLVSTLPVFFGDLQHASRGELAQVLRYLGAVISHEFTAIGEIIHLNTRLMEIAGYSNNICKLLELIDRIEQEEKRPKEGRIEEGENIAFENVIPQTPNDNVKLLNKGITFELVQGRGVLITGPNGAGKSSLFRVLGGLWPIEGGIIRKPRGVSHQGLHEEIYYVPQKPYNAIGTLKENITYPLCGNDVSATDEELIDILKLVRLEGIVEREGGFHVEKVWDDILSLGEQQRLAMARLFYHRPKFAVLDDCTSAVSAVGERELYEVCRKLNITCITISIRPALLPYHDFDLRFDGNGGWSVRKIDHDQVTAGNEAATQKK